MGNVLSRNIPLRDRIFQLEAQINKTEGKLSNLRSKSIFGHFTLLSFICIPLASFILYIEDIYPIFFTSALVTLFIAYHLIAYIFIGYRISANEAHLKLLKEQQKIMIREFKKESSFTHAKDLIEKYDDEECRKTFFSVMQKKKKDSVEKLTDFVLGNDPSKMNALICNKCGIHNGLIDPSNSEFNYFYCYSCRAKNIRSSGLGNKETF